MRPTRCMGVGQWCSQVQRRTKQQLSNFPNVVRFEAHRDKPVKIATYKAGTQTKDYKEKRRCVTSSGSRRAETKRPDRLEHDLLEANAVSGLAPANASHPRRFSTGFFPKLPFAATDKALVTGLLDAFVTAQRTCPAWAHTYQTMCFGSHPEQLRPEAFRLPKQQKKFLMLTFEGTIVSPEHAVRIFVVHDRGPPAFLCAHVLLNTTELSGFAEGCRRSKP